MINPFQFFAIILAISLYINWRMICVSFTLIEKPLLDYTSIMHRFKCRVWVIFCLYCSFLLLTSINFDSISFRQICWRWQLLLLLIGSENNIVVKPRYIVLVAYNLIPLIVSLIIVAVVVFKGRIRNTDWRAQAACATSLSLEQLLFAFTVH